jgi:hypothetical protein
MKLHVFLLSCYGISYVLGWLVKFLSYGVIMYNVWEEYDEPISCPRDILLSRCKCLEDGTLG